MSCVCIDAEPGSPFGQFSLEEGFKFEFLEQLRVADQIEESPDNFDLRFEDIPGGVPFKLAVIGLGPLASGFCLEVLLYRV